MNSCFKRRWLVLFVALFLTATFSGCVSSEGRIYAPFDDSAYVGEDVSDVTERLAEAGFTNIELDAVDTTLESYADTVKRIQFGKYTMWNSANTFWPDVLVTVEYYNYTGIRHIEVEMDITTSGEDGKPVFTVNTNLPDGTLLGIELSYTGSLTDGHEDYVQSQDVTVMDGCVTTEPFTNNGEPLVGDYLLSVIMLPSEQSDTVKEVVGSKGESLKGDYVEDLDTYQFISADISYTSPIVEEVPETTPATEETGTEKLSQEEMEALLREMLSGFGDNYEIELSDKIYTVNVWGDGISLTATLANLGYESSKEDWERLTSSSISAQLNLQKALDIHGYEDYTLLFQILNDQNLENTLLSIVYGMVFYNYVE